ncbi:putative inactive receptor kinase RLK902 [Platanthera zijinensis]|uniref:Inactive receptor kinase RLK902 n=1 Tax=Platanthera zijinensis TaxID=2320716 RepID=A0AAP0BW01_9ASPA
MAAAGSTPPITIPLLFLLLITAATSDTTGDFKLSLLSFVRKLSESNPQIDRDLGWTANSDPCRDRWRGIACNKNLNSVKSIVIESLQLDGSIDGNLLSQVCNSSSLAVLSIKDNALEGGVPPEIGACSGLTHVYLADNRLSGSIPSSLPNLKNLKRLDISNNKFSGELPWNMSAISGLMTFLAGDNNLTGRIPNFALNGFDKFDVSFNQFSGPVPQDSEKFPISSFAGNPGLCGKPLEECRSPDLLLPPPPLPPPPTTNPKSSKISTKEVFMVIGYVLFGIVVVFLVFIFLKKRKKNKHSGELSEKVSSEISRRSAIPSHSEYSISSSAHSIAGVSTSLVVLRKDKIRELKFEELLRAPAELLGKGRFGSLYKVVIYGCAELAVKRIKDWTVSGEEFQKKIMRMDQARHPNVLPVTAFYCSKQEKLVVYEFQKNGSLFKLLHDNKEGRPLSWASRLNVAAGVSAGLAFMQRSLAVSSSAAGHGNLKSSNILFSSSMEPLISEYGLTALPTHRHQPNSDKASVAAAGEPFSTSADSYAFGIILLELLTGRPSHGFNLAQWVHSVVREEWTVEVFDRSLLGDSDIAQESMVRLLQVALQCMDSSPEVRPSMAQVAGTIAVMKEEERSVDGKA